MDDKFTEVVGGIRGQGVKRAPLEQTQSAESVLQGIVDQLNDFGALPAEAMYGDGLEALIEHHGFVVREWLSTDREEGAEHWQHCGFMLGIAHSEGQRVFAFLRLREGPDPASPDMPYAQLLVPYVRASAS